MAKHWWIFVAVVICLLLVPVIARSVARSRSGLDRKEMAVVQRAGPLPFSVGGGGGGGGIVGLVLIAFKLLVLASWLFAYYSHRAAVKKVVGFNPRKRDRAEGVIFSFYELRITRTELIKGYEEDARRIRLQGLTATVTKTDTVDITIEGPDPKLFCSRPHDVLAGFNLRRARRFAALVNYEASLQGAPPKKVQEKPPTTSGAQ